MNSTIQILIPPTLCSSYSWIHQRIFHGRLFSLSLEISTMEAESLMILTGDAWSQLLKVSALSTLLPMTINSHLQEYTIAPWKVPLMYTETTLIVFHSVLTLKFLACMEMLTLLMKPKNQTRLSKPF